MSESFFEEIQSLPARREGVGPAWLNVALVIGAGRTGRAVAEELLRSSDAEVHLTDASDAALLDAQATIQGRAGDAARRLRVHRARGFERADLDVDGIILCIPWAATWNFLDRAAAESDTSPIVSITRPAYSDLARLADFSSRPRRAVYLPAGLEPGLVELLALHARRLMPDLCDLVVACGGIPEVPSAPLYHRLMFGDRIAVDDRQAWLVHSGQATFTTRFADPKPIVVPGIGVLEGYHDGMMPSTATHAAFSSLRRFEQRTLRWPGFAARMTMLRDMGFWSDAPVEVDGTAIKVAEFTHRVLARDANHFGTSRDLGIVHLEATHRDGALSAATIRWSGNGQLTAVAAATAVTAAATLRHHLPGTTGWRGPTSADFPIDAGTILRRLSERSVTTITGTGELKNLSEPLGVSCAHA